MSAMFGKERHLLFQMPKTFPHILEIFRDVHDLLQDRAVIALYKLLMEHSHPDPLFDGDLSVIRRESAFHHPQNCRLARAVRADYPYAVAPLDA